MEILPQTKHAEYSVRRRYIIQLIFDIIASRVYSSAVNDKLQLRPKLPSTSCRCSKPCIKHLFLTYGAEFFHLAASPVQRDKLLYELGSNLSIQVPNFQANF